MDTYEKLNRLSDMQAQLDVIRLHFDNLREQVMTPEIKQALADIDAEQATTMETMQGGIDQLTAEIKGEVIAGGATVKGAHLMAVYAKGRVTWDSKLLEGLMIAVPALAQARKEGEPSVALRGVK